MDQILEQDLSPPKKQRHTAKRIYERLRDEHGFPGKYTIVKDYVRERRRHTREMFLPLSHPPGHAQCDYGEARVIIGGVERKAHYFALDLPHSDGCYVKAYPAETTESFCDGHVSAFAFLGGVPQSILYDNTTLAVARILGDGRRQRTRVFSELQSHYLFEDRFGRPGKGNDKGKVEGLVGYVRRNFLVPIPSFESFDALNAHLEQHCLRRFEDRLRGHNEIMYQTAPDVSQVIDEVVGHGAITTRSVPDRPYTMIGMLRRAWVLRDEDGVSAGWLERTETYPRLLKHNILGHFAPILRENTESLVESAERRFGPSVYIFFLMRAGDALDSMLYAINDTYDPAEKRAERTLLPTLANVPRDFLQRYRYVLEGPFDDPGALERARVFSELSAEVLELAEATVAFK